MFFGTDVFLSPCMSACILGQISESLGAPLSACLCPQALREAACLGCDRFSGGMRGWEASVTVGRPKANPSVAVNILKWFYQD